MMQFGVHKQSRAVIFFQTLSFVALTLFFWWMFDTDIEFMERHRGILTDREMSQAIGIISLASFITAFIDADNFGWNSNKFSFNIQWLALASLGFGYLYFYGSM